MELNRIQREPSLGQQTWVDGRQPESLTPHILSFQLSYKVALRCQMCASLVIRHLNAGSLPAHHLKCYGLPPPFPPLVDDDFAYTANLKMALRASQNFPHRLVCHAKGEWLNVALRINIRIIFFLISWELIELRGIATRFTDSLCGIQFQFANIGSDSERLLVIYGSFFSMRVRTRPHEVEWKRTWPERNDSISH